MSIIKLAVPSNAPGGVEAEVSAHFGHCDLYTIVEVDGQTVKSVNTLDNPPHQEGGCLAPVQRLAEHGVNKLLAGGMGHRPLSGFHQVGIEVLLCRGPVTVSQAVEAYLAGQLPSFSMDSVCGGCGGH